MYGLAGICLFEMLNPFVELAFGKKYLFQREIVLILCINFFINGCRKSVLIFKESMGLFWYDRYKAIVEAVLNLGISIFLVTRFGIAGVFAGTFCSTVLTSVWVEPYIIYKHRFGKSPWIFFTRYAGNLLVMAVAWWCADQCCKLITSGPLVTLIFRLVVCAVVPNIILFLSYGRTEEFRAALGLAKRIFEKLRNRIFKK